MMVLLWEVVVVVAVVWLLYGVCLCCALIYQGMEPLFGVAVIFVWPLLVAWVVFDELIGDWLLRRRATHTASAKRR